MKGLVPIDWLIIVLYGCGTLGLGWYHGRRQRTTQEYFKGSGRMNPVLIGVSLFATLLRMVGFALLGYYQANPHLIPSGMDLKTDADKIFPNFIAFHLPPIVSGLVVSGLFAASMSSLNSGINSITAVVMTDFLDRFRHRPVTEREHVLYARILAFGIGSIVVMASSLIKYVPGNITEITTKISGLLTVPIFCLFYFALFFKRSSPAGVWIGAICGVATSILIAFAQPIFHLDHDPVSFQWMGSTALAVNIVVGILASLLLPATPKSQPHASG